MNNNQQNKSKLYCPECHEFVEDASDLERYCQTCGAARVKKVIETTEVPPSEPNIDSIRGFFDVIGVDLMSEIERLNAESQTTKVISKEYFDSIGKITLDSRLTLLHNCSLRIGPLRIRAVCADFSPLQCEGITAPIVMCTHQHGESTFQEACRGSIVVVKRGVVTFATKVKNAIAAGAVAVVVLQSFAMWPFVMSDSTDELNGIESCIPVVMMSQSDSRVVMKLFDIDSKYSKSATISISPGDVECSICQEHMKQEDVVIKLPCNHAYHHVCVSRWLEGNNTCPMCRHELPLQTVVEREQAARATVPRPLYIV